MGYLHAGHTSLMRRARREVGPDGQVVVSIYVNPTQFGPKEDFTKYPRELARDKRLCRQAAVDALFIPSGSEMYPESKEEPFTTFVVEERLSRAMEGASRPTHFRGVTTVVAKLLNIVLPDVAIFGTKDFQQAAVIQKMVRDLNFPVKIIVAPTVREAGGLAMSSRNKYLSPDERRQAVVLSEALAYAAERVRNSSEPLSSARLKRELMKFIERRPVARVDYIEFFDPSTLQPVKQVSPGTRMALAVFVGKTRLIDNAGL